MAKSITVKHKKKPGRPATGHDPFVGIRLPEGLLAQIAKWSEANEAGSRSEAIRRLLEIGLKAKK
jgi:Ribbon-helix-helix protein, copG family